MPLRLQGGQAADRAGHEAARVARPAFHEGALQEPGPEASCQDTSNRSAACSKALPMGKRLKQRTTVM